MARKPKQTQEINKAYDDPAPWKRAAIGNVGLRISAGNPLEETVRELQWPNNIRIYQTMQNDSVIAAAVDFFRMMIRRSNWYVKSNPNDSEVEKAHQKFLDECLFKDMEDSFGAFLQEVSSFIIYGHSLHEIVWRPRLRRAGSKFNDGKIGLKKLSPRSQASITKFVYEDNELIGFKQNLNEMQASAFRNYTKTDVVIHYEKCLLFRVGTSRDNPVGRSPLAAVFHDWKARCAIAESESIGSIRDLGGISVLYAPPQIMSGDASDEQKATFEYMKNMVRNLHSGHQSGVVLPAVYDEVSKQPLFSLKLLNVDGSKMFDSNVIIERYNKSILTKLFADILIMGQSSTGSYALGTIKSQLTALAAETYLSEIRDVINHDLIPRLFELNGITLEQYPEIAFDDLSNTDLDVYSKAVQRLASTGMLVTNKEVLDKNLEMLGIDPLAEDFSVEDFKAERNITSRSGDGMKTPFEGTSTGGAGTDDSSVGNMENA